MAVTEIRITADQVGKIGEAAKQLKDGGLAALGIVHIDGTILRIPTDEDFGTGAFLEDQTLAIVAERIRRKHPVQFSHIDQASVTYLWKRTGGRFHKQPILGHTVQPSGLAKHFAGCDFIVWFAADHLRDLEGLTPEYMEALIVHESLHIGWDEDEEACTIVDHDFMGFTAEIPISGFWQEDLRAMRAVVQPRLFEEDERSVDHTTGEIHEVSH